MLLRIAQMRENAGGESAAGAIAPARAKDAHADSEKKAIPAGGMTLGAGLSPGESVTGRQSPLAFTLQRSRLGIGV